MSNQEAKLDVESIENEHVKLTVTRSPHCRVKFDIQVAPQAVSAAYAKALKNVNKEVNIPGFRKGKAPTRLIQEKYNSVIQKEWIDIVLETAFNEALKLSHLYPLKDGHMGRPVVHECNEEKGAQLTLEFEARPQIPAIQFQDLTLKRIEPKAVTEQDVQQTLNYLTRQFTQYEPVEGRPVQEGDFVDITVDLLQDGESKRIAEDYRAQTNEEGFPIWLRDKLIGLEIGQSVEGEVPAEHAQEENASKESEIRFQMTLNKIWHGNVPPIDDELAKKAGVESLEELKKRIEERLVKERELEAFERRLEELDHLLVERYAFDIPLSFIEKNAEERFDDYIAKAQSENRTFNAEQEKQIRKAIEQAVIQQIQLQFLLGKVGYDYHIKVSDADVNQELQQQISLMPLGRSYLDVTSNQEEMRNRLYTTTLYRKIREFLIDKATYI